ncbi:MAG: endonuclease [Alcanivorax sp.]|nr:endonuclease [Alcanivorax sp.]
MLSTSCRRRLSFAGLAVWLLLAVTAATAAPATFERAKTEARQHVYFDRTAEGTLYCGCAWHWTGRSGGRIDFDSCGYQVRAQETRAARLEWEHVVPASNFGRARQCWQEGGRRNCNATDPVFNAMEADMHNLSPSVGEVNGDRSNFRFTELPGVARQHGACDFRVDFAQRAVEPRDAVKGQVARITFYMHDRYDLPMADAQQRLLMAWDRQFPVSEWERERDLRIAARMGHHNPFVTGARQWQRGHRNSGEGILSRLPDDDPAMREPHAGQPVRGNRNSNLYHLPQGCPGYHQISERNVVVFEDESAALAAGFRKAGNCR